MPQARDAAIPSILFSLHLLTSAGERFRGRVMGVRMLAISGVPIGS